MKKKFDLKRIRLIAALVGITLLLFIVLFASILVLYVYQYQYACSGTNYDCSPSQLAIIFDVFTIFGIGAVIEAIMARWIHREFERMMDAPTIISSDVHHSPILLYPDKLGLGAEHLHDYT